MPKTKVKKNLVIAEPHCCFWTCNGIIIKDLKELANALEKLDETTFVSHVNKTKNDFSKWINEILRDAELAKKISKIKTRTKMLKEIETHLKKNYTI